LALSLPEGPFKGLILAATYMVVMFSVVVQGSSVERIVRRLTPEGSGVRG
jgi:CPA1 family monovalent cation:H+ antiporter